MWKSAASTVQHQELAALPPRETQQANLRSISPAQHGQQRRVNSPLIVVEGWNDKRAVRQAVDAEVWTAPHARWQSRQQKRQPAALKLAIHRAAKHAPAAGWIACMRARLTALSCGWHSGLCVGRRAPLQRMHSFLVRLREAARRHCGMIALLDPDPAGRAGQTSPEQGFWADVNAAYSTCFRPGHICPCHCDHQVSRTALTLTLTLVRALTGPSSQP